MIRTTVGRLSGAMPDVPPGVGRGAGRRRARGLPFAVGVAVVPIAAGMSTTTNEAEAGVWVSAAEAATRMGVHPRTVERRAAAGTMRSRRDQGGRVEVFLPGVPERGAQRVEEPDRQLPVVTTALVRSLQGGVVEARVELATARRVGRLGWICAGLLLVGGSGLVSWGSWTWATERGVLDLAAAEARLKVEAAEALAASLTTTVVLERSRIAGLDARLAAADEERDRLVRDLALARERGDELRDALDAALADAAEDARQAAGRRPASFWDWLGSPGGPETIARHAPDTAPGTDEGR